MYSLFPSLFWRRLPLPWWALFRLGFGFEVVGWLLALWLRGSFLLRPPWARRLVFWSLRTVLGLLCSPRFCSSTSSFGLLRRDLFWWSGRLVSALLGSLSCSDVCLAGILFGGRRVYLAPSPGFFWPGPCGWVTCFPHVSFGLGWLLRLVNLFVRLVPCGSVSGPLLDVLHLVGLCGLVPGCFSLVATSHVCCVPSLRRLFLVLTLRVMV